MDFKEWLNSRKLLEELLCEMDNPEHKQLIDDFKDCWNTAKKETILKQNKGWGFGMDDESKLALNQIGECIGILVKKARQSPIPPAPKGAGILGD